MTSERQCGGIFLAAKLRVDCRDDTWCQQGRQRLGDHLGACCSNSGNRGEDQVLSLSGEAGLDSEQGEHIHANRREVGRWADVIMRACASSFFIVYQITGTAGCLSISTE